MMTMTIILSNVSCPNIEICTVPRTLNWSPARRQPFIYKICFKLQNSAFMWPTGNGPAFDPPVRFCDLTLQNSRCKPSETFQRTWAVKGRWVRNVEYLQWRLPRSDDPNRPGWLNPMWFTMLCSSPSHPTNCGRKTEPTFKHSTFTFECMKEV